MSAKKQTTPGKQSSLLSFFNRPKPQPSSSTPGKKKSGSDDVQIIDDQRQPSTDEAGSSGLISVFNEFWFYQPLSLAVPAVPAKEDVTTPKAKSKSTKRKRAVIEDDSPDECKFDLHLFLL